jgi:hypothetical protein
MDAGNGNQDMYLFEIAEGNQLTGDVRLIEIIPFV